jgi:hypothetical protein
VFYFYSTSQKPENASYYRGLLFEDLLRTYLQAAGYKVDISRRKEHSLEYDIHGVHSIDQRKVIGEAKAHADPIAGKDVAAFIGKAVPMLHTGEYSALFLSCSPLSPEAEDYLRSMSATPYRVKHSCASELEAQIRRTLQLPDENTVRHLCAPLIPVPSGQHLLHTNRGTFVVVLGCGEPSAFDDRFAVVSSSGALVSDADILAGLRAAIQAFRELQPVHGAVPAIAQLAIPARRIPHGLLTATDWFDYRRPTGEQYFVGRQDELERVESLAISSPATVVEIKARSGVGKSSLVSVLAARWQQMNHIVELHDARDVQSIHDVLTIIQRFCGFTTRLASLEDVPVALEKLAKSLGGRRAIFIVDQFESTFASPDVYSAYEYLALCIARANAALALVFTRKDDLLTTHDELVVSLERLRGIAQSISLEDFDRNDASALLQQMAQAHPKRLSARILGEVLEFAQGFPWLLKRTMAHVVALVDKGSSQSDLLSSGLQLKQLFQEEIAELDELERGYLVRLAAVLPATYHALSHHFEGDPLLRQMLESLTGRRLLRLSAGTYDTYNDVLKDFLLYERLPDRSEAQALRYGLAPVMRAFRALEGRNEVIPEEFAAALGKSLGSTYNLLRELRLAGLVARGETGWSVPTVVRQYEHQERLGEYVRQSIIKNRLVSDLLALFETRGSIPRTEIVEILQNALPFVQATELVWDGYARCVLDWLVGLKFAVVNENDIVEPVGGDKEEVIRSLGNLHLAGRGTRGRSRAFLPQASWGTAQKLLAAAQSRPVVRTKLRV